MDPTHLLAPGVAAALAVSTALALVGPVVAVLIWRWRSGAPWRAVGAGALVFFVSQMILRLPWQAPLAAWMARSTGAQGPVWLGFLLLSALTAGLFEEPGRWLGYRWLLRHHLDRRAGVAYGLGHGGLEAMLLVGLSVGGLLVAALAADAGKLPPGPALDAVRQQVAGLTPFQALAAGVERASAMVLHVGLSLVVLQAFTRGGARWVWLSIALHFSINASAMLVMRQAGVWPTEALTAVAAGVVLWLGLRLTRAEVVPGTASCTSLRSDYEEKLRAEFAAQPLVPSPPLTETDLAHLPAPVQRYLRRSGAVGQPRPQNVRVEFEARMWRKPGDAPMPASSVQHNFLGRPTRLFFMKARMFGLPVQVLHAYAGEQATMRVRVASLLNMVDLAGDELSTGETVTVLNDMCFFAPGALIDPRLQWEPLDDRTVKVTFVNGRRRVAATLHFNERDELVNFTSDDRAALLPDGTLRRYRWSTPVEGYHEVGGRWLPGRGAAVYAYPEGDFTYGDFVLKAIAYDQAGPPATP